MSLVRTASRAAPSTSYAAAAQDAGEALEGVDAPRIDIHAVPATERRVRITVADNGPGIPPALAHDVFLPFFTTKPRGTGIGLSFARKVVLLHGGQIGLCTDRRGCFEMLLGAAAD